MGYESSKIYRLQHDDGHFYIGSTLNELRMRLGQHKRCKTDSERRVYKHINNEWDKVKIVLIEAFECSNRDELRRKENEYIQKELKNELCLNHRREYLTEQEKKENNQITEKKYREENADKISERKAKYYIENADKIKAQQKAYKERKKAEQGNITTNITAPITAQSE
jgi:hypothetical protein